MRKRPSRRWFWAGVAGLLAAGYLGAILGIPFVDAWVWSNRLESAKAQAKSLDLLTDVPTAEERKGFAEDPAWIALRDLAAVANRLGLPSPAKAGVSPEDAAKILAPGHPYRQGLEDFAKTRAFKSADLEFQPWQPELQSFYERLRYFSEALSHHASAGAMAEGEDVLDLGLRLRAVLDSDDVQAGRFAAFLLETQIVNGLIRGLAARVDDPAAHVWTKAMLERLGSAPTPDAGMSGVLASVVPLCDAPHLLHGLTGLRRRREVKVFGHTVTTRPRVAPQGDLAKTAMVSVAFKMVSEATEAVRGAGSGPEAIEALNQVLPEFEGSDSPSHFAASLGATMLREAVELSLRRESIRTAGKVALAYADVYRRTGAIPAEMPPQAQRIRSPITGEGHPVAARPEQVTIYLGAAGWRLVGIDAEPPSLSTASVTFAPQKKAPGP